MKITRNLVMGGFAALALLVGAACSGGSSSTPNVTYPSPANLGSGSLSTSSTTTISMTASSGLGIGSVGFKGTGSVSVSQSVNAPTSLAPLTRKSLKGVASPRAQATTDPNTAIAYITVTATSAATLNSLAGVAVTPTGTIPPAPYYLAYWNGTQWVTFAGTGTLSGGVISFSTLTLNPAVTLASGASYYLAVYTGVIFVTPPPPPAPSPSALTVSVAGQGTFNVVSGSKLTLTASSSNASVATVSSSAITDSSGNATFTVTGVAVGSATITITDPYGKTGTVAVTVNNVPSPSQTAGVIGVQDTLQLNVATTATTINAVSSNTGVLTVSPTAAPASNNSASFTLTGVAPGTATVTFTDPATNASATFSATVSAVRNGGFEQGNANWSTCSFAHTALTTPVLPTGAPTPPIDTTAQTASTSVVASVASALATPYPASSVPNANPNFLTAVVPALGNNVELVGSLDSSVVNYPIGAFGICQAISVPAASTTQYLSLDAWFAGSGYGFKNEDQEVDILTGSPGSYTLAATLFAEQSCWMNPTAATLPGPKVAPGGSVTGACTGGTSGTYIDWLNGGYWVQLKGMSLASFAGQNVTLFIGNWSAYANSLSKYAQVMFVDNVETTVGSTPSPVAVQSRKTYTVNLIHR